VSVDVEGAVAPVHADAEAERKAAPRAPRLVRRFWVQALSLAIFLGLWEYAGSTSNPVLFATPQNVVRAFVKLMGNGQLEHAFRIAVEDLAAGYSLSVVVGMLIGLAMGRSSVFSRAMSPYINFMQATPVIALVPLMVIWFGIDFKARVAVVFMFGVWTMIINTEAGVKGTPRNLMEVARIYHLNEWQIVRTLALPNAVPLIFAGLRIALGKALIGVIIAEIEVTLVGLGGLIGSYGQTFQTAYLLAGVLAASVVGVLTAGLLSWSMRHFFPWVEATSAGAVRE
jgi:ABC-type nitrate/sulfonate/bicarbonate transport system permease component